MTGYTVHTGSNIKFSGGWDRIFSGKANGSSKPKTSAPASAKKAAAKKSTKKKASKKKK